MLISLPSLFNNFGNSCYFLSSVVLSVIKYQPTDNIQLKKKIEVKKLS